MQLFKLPTKNSEIILALGAESAGNFSIFSKNIIHYSSNYGDLSQKNNFHHYKKELLTYLKKNNLKPNIILTDLHPYFHTTQLGQQLAKKFKAQHLKIQHHYAHLFSSIGDKLIHNQSYKIPDRIYGIILDGTGYGLDEKIWGGEIFQLKIQPCLPAGRNSKLKVLNRIGSLENQKMLGGELAIREPARMLISILSNFLSEDEIYAFVKKYYTQNEFKILSKQLQQNFNCPETSSAGRILDSVSLLLGFTKNERAIKHQATILLEKNSTKPFLNLKPVILKNSEKSIPLENYKLKIDSKFKIQNSKFILQTTPLFKYLIKNLKKDKQRLAATAQRYIAQGLMEIIKLDAKKDNLPIFISGGISKNKIVSQYLVKHGAYQNKKISPGDEGLSFGQIIYYLYF